MCDFKVFFFLFTNDTKDFFLKPFWNKWITGVKLLQSLQWDNERRQKELLVCVLKSAETVCGLTAGTAGGVRSEISGSGVKKKKQKTAGCAFMIRSLYESKSRWENLKDGRCFILIRINTNPFCERRNVNCLCIFQRVNVGAEFQCGSQFKVHGADQVVLCQEQQSLPVDFLGAKCFGYILPTWREERTVSSYLCVTTFKGAQCSCRGEILIRREIFF